ncbi:MAG: methyltransferase domain-containing protein [Elusimicrobiota bacterium]
MKKSLWVKIIRPFISLLAGLLKSPVNIYQMDFDRCAETYDSAATRNLLGGITAELIKKLDLKSGWRCLELGCGSGEATKIIDRLIQPNGSLKACDISEKMINAAKAKFAADNSVTEFVQQDMVNFLQECPANYFDLAAGFWSIDYSDPKRILSEIKRVLVKNGMTAMLVNTQQSLLELQEIVVPLLLKHPFALKCLPGINFPRSAKFFKKLTEEAGLVLESMENKKCQYCFQSAEAVMVWMKEGGPCAGFRGALKEKYREHIFEHIRERIERKGNLTVTFDYLVYIGKK